MNDMFVASDVAVIDLLRKHSALSVTDMAEALRVTPTAIRQRLSRLLAHGYLVRETVRAGRGRPSHQYSLTESGRRKSGANFADLAVALWEEIRSIQDAEVRRGLLKRISGRLASIYADQVQGETLDERMAALAELFQSRQIPFEVEQKSGLPVLQARACPYPGLAETDRGICAMERLLFEELLGRNVTLNDCRLDGGSCCTFEVSSVENDQFGACGGQEMGIVETNSGNASGSLS